MRHIYRDMHAALDAVKSLKANPSRKGERPTSDQNGWAKFYSAATRNPGDSFQSQIADVIQIASDIAEDRAEHVERDEQ